MGKSGISRMLFFNVSLLISIEFLLMFHVEHTRNDVRNILLRIKKKPIILIEMMTIEELKTLVRDVPDFPQKGIIFKDITTMLKNKDGLHLAAKLLSEQYADKGITKVVGIESRGFIMGPIVAEKIGAGFVPIRKPGKLPADTVSESYTKEYGVDTIEIHTDAINENDVVLLHDDLLATGGTMYAAYLLAKRFNPKKIYVSFIAELEFLNGRKLFPADVEIDALIKY